MKLYKNKKGRIYVKVKGKKVFLTRKKQKSATNVNKAKAVATIKQYFSTPAKRKRVTRKKAVTNSVRGPLEVSASSTPFNANRVVSSEVDDKIQKFMGTVNQRLQQLPPALANRPPADPELLRFMQDRVDFENRLLDAMGNANQRRHGNVPPNRGGPRVEEVVDDPVIYMNEQGIGQIEPPREMPYPDGDPRNAAAAIPGSQEAAQPMPELRYEPSQPDEALGAKHYSLTQIKNLLPNLFSEINESELQKRLKEAGIDTKGFQNKRPRSDEKQVMREHGFNTANFTKKQQMWVLWVKTDDFRKYADAEIARRMSFGTPKKEGRGRTAGLYDDEIESVMKKYRNFLGVWSADELTKLIPHIHAGQKIGWIANVDPHDKKGSHWVAWFVDPQNHSIEYFDSFGEEPPQVMVHQLRGIAAKADPHQFMKLKVNKVKHQDDSTSNCGQFAMKFLIDRFRGKSFAEATGYDQRIIDKSKKYEKEIEELKKQPPFKYIGN